jgi:hypothetical protein
MAEFHPDCQKCPDCPPKEANPINGSIWRGVKELPLGENDFLSYAELELPNSDKQNCDHWGLSVWISEADVHHARGLHRYMRRWHVASGKVDRTTAR